MRVWLSERWTLALAMVDEAQCSTRLVVTLCWMFCNLIRPRPGVETAERFKAIQLGRVNSADIRDDGLNEESLVAFPYT